LSGRIALFTNESAIVAIGVSYSMIVWTFGLIVFNAVPEASRLMLTGGIIVAAVLLQKRKS